MIRRRQTHQSSSLKRQMIDLLDQYLLGRISSRELIGATIPMLMLSAHKRGRKNYIEKYLLDLSAKQEEQITREYILEMREAIMGDTTVNEKDRKKLLKRTVRKLIERLLFDEIDIHYFLSAVYDLMGDYHDTIESEPTFEMFFEEIRNVSGQLERNDEDQKKIYAAMIEYLIHFYQEQYRTLWDE